MITRSIAMSRTRSAFLIWSLIAVSLLCLCRQARAEDRLEIDPMLLVALKECRNIVEQMPGGFYPGWDFAAMPVLFYKPGVQDLLINFPHAPEGFREYRGFSPLGDERIYVRDGETTIAWDDQNTTREIDGVITLVVADTQSSLRNNLRGVFNQQDAAFINNWLDDWSFQSSPYGKIQLILHEAFHAHQAHLAPEKGADEGSISRYPLLDPINNALSQLEGFVLRDALLATDEDVFHSKVAEFVAIRRHRQGRLEQEAVDYENLNEFVEGTAKYIEYRFLKDGRDLEAREESYYHQGFHGFSKLPELFAEQLDDMVAVIGVTDDRFGNKFGGGPLRFKLYDLGAAQSLLLDRIRPGWQAEIFADGVYLCDLIADSAALGGKEEAAALARAKQEHGYETLLAGKREFEVEGRRFIQAKVDAILKTEQTLVSLDFSGSEITGMGYTPFGVTQVGPESAIYDMVPLQVKFDEDKLLSLKQVRPVLLDKDSRELHFAVDIPVAEFVAGVMAGLDNDSFVFQASAIDVATAGNKVSISWD